MKRHACASAAESADHQGAGSPAATASIPTHTPSRTFDLTAEVPRPSCQMERLRPVYQKEMSNR